MKFICQLIRNGYHEEAYRRIEKNEVKKGFAEENVFFKMISAYSLVSESAQILRSLHYKHLLYNEVSEIVKQIEYETIATHNWEEIKKMCARHLLSIENLMFLLCEIYQNVDSKEARETMLFYDGLCDLNKVQWPEKFAGHMQNMIAEIAIKNAIS